ncbi:MAG: hypothetical protein K6C97_04425 [Treponema sp.]|nr:hypothetical protein [Treponema sp.]
MKKHFIIFTILTFFTINSYAQTHTSVSFEDDVYMILDYAELKGWTDPLPANKPYTQEVILKAIDQIWRYEDLLTNNEADTLWDYVEKYTKPSKLKNNFFHLDFSNGEDAKVPITFNYDFSLTGQISGGLYNLSSRDQYGYEIIPEIYFDGDFSKYISWKFDALLDITRMPLYYLGEYYCGQDWYTDHSDGTSVRNRYIKKYINTSYLPYSYNRKWDAKIYYLTNLSTTGLEGWPMELSVGLNMTADLRSSFFDDRLIIGLGRINREIAGMDNGASLVLNSRARAFTGLDMQANLFPFLNFTFLFGSLEYPSQKYMNENWYPETISGYADDATFFQNNYTLNMLSLEFKYFHLDFGSVVIWPNRFAIGYILPLANFVEYQNHLGDYDNLQMFGDMKFRYPGLGEAWISFFLDETELNIIKNNPIVFTRDMYAYQAGIKYVIPKLPFATLSFRYTKIEPYCYTHQSLNCTPWFNHYITENYTNDGYCIGYYLDPNSDEFRLDFDVKPVSNLRLNACYQFIRHGADYGSQQVPGSSLYSELQITGRENLRKYFLHDGAYEWSHILSFGAVFETHNTKFPFTIYGNIGGVFNYFTMIASDMYDSTGTASTGCNFSTPYSIVNTDEYPMTFGIVMSLGIKITL